MSKAIALLAVLAAAAGHTPRPPPPCIQHPPAPTPHIKVISAAACSLANGFGDYGPAAIETFGLTQIGGGNYAVNPNAPNAAIPTIILYCDARLPAEATALYFAELEYFAPAEVANSPPSLFAYLDVRAPDGAGYFYSLTFNAGSCTGPLTELYSGTNPLSTCATQTFASFGPDAGALSASAPPWTDFSVHFLVVIPPSPDPQLPNLAYRVVGHYEAP